jgi:hypothetical protein
MPFTQSNKTLFEISFEHYDQQSLYGKTDIIFVISACDRSAKDVLIAFCSTKSDVEININTITGSVNLAESNYIQNGRGYKVSVRKHPFFKNTSVLELKD